LQSSLSLHSWYGSSDVAPESELDPSPSDEVPRLGSLELTSEPSAPLLSVALPLDSLGSWVVLGGVVDELSSEPLVSVDEPVGEVVGIVVVRVSSWPSLLSTPPLDSSVPALLLPVASPSESNPQAAAAVEHNESTTTRKDGSMATFWSGSRGAVNGSPALGHGSNTVRQAL
jgi:hypothetical protein